MTQEDMEKELQHKSQKSNIVAALYGLSNLPVGAVLTHEYDAQQDIDYWEVNIVGETKRGLDLIGLLQSFSPIPA